MIPTRALPSMSYRVPERLSAKLDVGSAVVVPLSGYSRLGIVVEVERSAPERPLEEVKQVAGGLSISAGLVELCCWISENTAIPLPVALRNALPPGLKIDLYRVVEPAPGWSWKRGTRVERAALRREIGNTGLKQAETEGRIALSPAPARRESSEWVRPARGAPDLSRAPRQRELFEAIRERGEGRVRSLLEETGARRETLRQLATRGAVNLERRAGASPVVAAHGDPARSTESTDFEDLLERGGSHLWRLSGRRWAAAAAALARAALGRWEQTLILAPEIRGVERLVEQLSELLPAGATVAPYHSGLGRERVLAHEAARQGAVDVLVGTRAAALVPLSRPGAICVVDEPNPAHRAEPGFEGIPLHARELALERGRGEDASVLLLSPAPSLPLYASVGRGVREIPAPEPDRWPEARVVDMRGSGASFSAELLDACREVLEDTSDGRVGVLVNRLGYATSVSCSGCGKVVACGSCGLPLVLHSSSGGGSKGEMVCHHCADREPAPQSCAGCGSARLIPTGLAVERARESLAKCLGEEVGLSTAGSTRAEGSRVVVGTAHSLLREDWETVLVPDADSLIYGGGMLASERGFRTLYSAAEAAHGRILAQTRNPKDPVLDAALRGDYPSFAENELPLRRRAGYPPYRHLAAVTLQGTEAGVRRAVESSLKPLEPRVEVTGPVPLAQGPSGVWRVVIRASHRAELSGAASAAAEIPSAGSKKVLGGQEPALRLKIELDPEEV